MACERIKLPITLDAIFSRAYSTFYPNRIIDGFAIVQMFSRFDGSIIFDKSKAIVALQLATDPKLAYQKAKELWATLSLPEPENQARPTSLEQLLVLLTRESARRIVHLVNGTSTLAKRSPHDLGRILVNVSHQLLAVADATLKVSIVGVAYFLLKIELFYEFSRSSGLRCCHLLVKKMQPKCKC